MKFPKSIYLILCYVFCELFFLHGIGATISLYYVEVLMFKKSTAIILFHTYKMTIFFSSLMGGVMADSKVGKFRTIFYCSSASVIGGLLLTIGSITTLNLPIRAFSVTGLFFIAVGTGGIRPCISTFGGEQFKLPEERALVSAFFAIYYSVMDIGKTTTTFVIPILRKDITCFGNDTCYPLAYLTLTILRILSLENMSIKYGGVYTIVGYISENIKVMRIVTLVNPNSIHLFCQLPQYILITIGEIMLQNVLGEFVFSEAPLYMKSLSYAGLLFTIASGNLMVIIIAKAQFFQRQVFEYFLYAVLMFIDIFIFAILAKSYKYVEMSSDESLHETLQKRTK